ncbi:hypothetical protein [Novosphingobium sp. TCA1]|uniref:hypothetical protein n=1 Tax=Novosphingobium sp. TCA1 TaxID=2682474 RepID=UPI001308D2A0|nr:hypothetical protein [Novosphingobium sp. TCA1]GFE73673.1 hypothetical protein NTCA1_13220 [Novosphingobium sp. TCA1]
MHQSERKFAHVDAPKARKQFGSIAGVLFVFFSTATQAEAPPSSVPDVLKATTTYICTLDRPDGAMTLLALQTSSTQKDLYFRATGLNGWPEKTVSAKAQTLIAAPIPPFEGGISHLVIFETSMAGSPYRFQFTVSQVPVLKAHKPIDQNGIILTNRSATLSVSTRQQNATNFKPVGSGYCEVQKDAEVFELVE